MTVEPVKVPPQIAEVVARVMGRFQSSREFAERFVCPLKTGGETRCEAGTERVPYVPLPSGAVIECPSWKEDRCFRHEGWLQYAAAEEEQRWQREAREFGIPRRFWAASFEDSKPTLALEHVRRFYVDEAGQGKCLLLMGPNGVGKTWAAVCFARAWMTEKRGPTRVTAFWHYPTLAGILMDLSRKGRALDAVKNAGLLVLDDFGSEYQPGVRSTVSLAAIPMLMTLLDEIIWWRYENVLTTIMTSRMLPEIVQGRVTDNVWDRLHSTWARAELIEGESLRAQAGA